MDGQAQVDVGSESDNNLRAQSAQQNFRPN